MNLGTNTQSTNTEDTVGNSDLQAGLTRLAVGQGVQANLDGVSSNTGSTYDYDPTGAGSAVFGFNPIVNGYATSYQTFGSASNIGVVSSINTAGTSGKGGPVVNTGNGVLTQALNPANPNMTPAQQAGLSSALSFNSAEITAQAASQAAAAAAASQTAMQQAAFQAGLSTASMMPTSAEDAAQSNNTLYSQGGQAMVGGGAYAGYAAATGQAGKQAVEGANSALASATDKETQIQNESQFLSDSLDQQIQQHGLDAQATIQNITDTLAAFQSQLGSLQGQDAENLKAKTAQMNNLLTTLKTQYGADQQADANFWQIVGTVASIAAGVVAVAA